MICAIAGRSTPCCRTNTFTLGTESIGVPLDWPPATTMHRCVATCCGSTKVSPNISAWCSARAADSQPKEEFRDGWADVAALMESHRGREWRPLVDTAVGAQLGYQEPDAWKARMRGTDFYRESALLSLEADALIRSSPAAGKAWTTFAAYFMGRRAAAPKSSPTTSRPSSPP